MSYIIDEYMQYKSVNLLAKMEIHKILLYLVNLHRLE